MESQSKLSISGAFATSPPIKETLFHWKVLKATAKSAWRNFESLAKRSSEMPVAGKATFRGYIDERSRFLSHQLAGGF